MLRLLVLLFLPFAAHAQGTLSTLGHDIDGDGNVDQFVLTADGDAAHLDVTFGDGSTSRAKSVAWVGSFGQQPELILSGDGALQIHSRNESIGPNRWHQLLTLGWRDGAIVVTGFTYDWFDTQDTAAGGHCDINMLTGQGVRQPANGSAELFATTLPSVTLTDWDEQPIWREQLCVK